MRNRIFGAIGVAWGGWILISFFFFKKRIEGQGAYASGQMTGLVFGGLMFVVGLYYLIQGDRPFPFKPKRRKPRKRARDDEEDDRPRRRLRSDDDNITDEPAPPRREITASAVKNTAPSAEHVTCSNCQKKLKVPAQLIGKKVKCVGCGTVFVA